MKTTLSKFQQSELKRFEKKLDIRNDCSNVKDKHDEYCQGCVLIAVEEVDYLKEYVSSTIEKAYALGKEEEAKRWINQPNNEHDEKIRSEVKKEILAGLKKIETNRMDNALLRKIRMTKDIERKKVLGHEHSKNRNRINGYNSAIQEVINLLKNK